MTSRFFVHSIRASDVISKPSNANLVKEAFSEFSAKFPHKVFVPFCDLGVRNGKSRRERRAQGLGI